MKEYARRLLTSIATKWPIIIDIVAVAFYAFPRLAIAIAQGSERPDIILSRTWRRRKGFLGGLSLTKLLPKEAASILDDQMEAKSTLLLSKLNLASCAVIDIGASYGYYTLLLSKLARGGHVYTFEPDLRSYGRLMANLELNKITNATAMPLCISGNRVELLRWFSNEKAPWNSSLGRVNSPGDGEVSIVPSVSLDYFCATLDLQLPLRLIKMDVEGAEVDVLRGAIATIERYRPLILCEIHSANLALLVFQFLREQNYEWRWIEYKDDSRQHIFAYDIKEAPSLMEIIKPLEESVKTESRSARQA